ncbi:MAG: UDP-N-acetylmuramoyl-tripeptide--D-alanyl-D-alanine ligase [Solirubrobacterales bacterium]
MLEPEKIAEAMGARIASRGGEGFPSAAAIDSRGVEGGELFFGLEGESEDGARFSSKALENGAWGVVVGSRFEGAAAAAGGWVFVVDDPLAALQALATTWRRELGCTVIGITGSVGKTSVKDIARAILPGLVHASDENFNTEIGLPLAILSAPEGTDTLVLEMAMRGPGQIAELASIAEPDVGVITTVGPVHLELLGSIEAIADAKAELIGGLKAGGLVIVPAEAGHLEPHLEGVAGVIRFGPGGDFHAERVERTTTGTSATVVMPEGSTRFEFPFTEAHNLTNALAAIAAAVSAGAAPEDLAARSASVAFSKLRGEHLTLPGGALVVNDCYNANPVSMRAALDYLAGLDRGPRIAVLGLMGELGPKAAEFHREVGEYARSLGIDVLVGVGPEAADYVPDHLVDDRAATVELLEGILTPECVVLIKGSRSAGLETVTEALLNVTVEREVTS